MLSYRFIPASIEEVKAAWLEFHIEEEAGHEIGPKSNSFRQRVVALSLARYRAAVSSGPVSYSRLPDHVCRSRRTAAC
jgi:hypothetical protein